MKSIIIIVRYKFTIVVFIKFCAMDLKLNLKHSDVYFVVMFEYDISNCNLQGNSIHLYELFTCTCIRINNFSQSFRI